MEKPPKRTIESAFFDNGIGIVYASDLVQMPSDIWGTLRDRITDQRNGSPNGCTAKCFKCGCDVFVRQSNVTKLPLFIHYKGGNPECPWYTGDTAHPKHVRAEQYQGQQESFAHKYLCAQIDELARLDSRYQKSKINEYLPPTASAFGRYPDVYVEWENFTPLVFEIQLSNTFQTEISARCTHYDREQAGLIWVLHDLNPNIPSLPQSFKDVIRRHRGNAFVIDRESIAKSKEEKTIVLKCYLKNEDDSFDEPKLIRVDSLQFPANGLPFLEDRIALPILIRAEKIRKPWVELLASMQGDFDEGVCVRSDVRELLFNLRRLDSTFTKSPMDFAIENYPVVRLIATILSIVDSTQVETKNYASRQSNLTAMLNSCLYGEWGKRYANLIEQALRRSVHAKLLKGSVGDHIFRARESYKSPQCSDNDPEWRLMKILLPEMFDAKTRKHLLYLNALPLWAPLNPDEKV